MTFFKKQILVVEVGSTGYGVNSWCSCHGSASYLLDKILNFSEPSFPHLKNPKVVRIAGINPCKVLSQSGHMVSV